MRIDAYRNNEQIDLVLQDIEILHIKIDVTKAHTGIQVAKSTVLKLIETASVTDDDQVSGGFISAVGDFRRAHSDSYHRISDDAWLVYVSFNRNDTAIRFFFIDSVAHFAVIPTLMSPANDMFEHYNLADRGFELA